MRMIDLELATIDLNKNFNLYYTTNNLFYPISKVISTSEYFILIVTPSDKPLLLQDLLHVSELKSRHNKLFIQTIDKNLHLILGYKIEHNKLFLA